MTLRARRSSRLLLLANGKDFRSETSMDDSEQNGLSQSMDDSERYDSPIYIKRRPNHLYRNLQNDQNTNITPTKLNFPILETFCNNTHTKNKPYASTSNSATTPTQKHNTQLNFLNPNSDKRTDPFGFFKNKRQKKKTRHWFHLNYGDKLHKKLPMWKQL